MGKKCFIPDCYTGYKKCKEKHPMYGAPKDPVLLQQWQEVIAREDRPLTSKDVVCGKHFKNDDLEVRPSGQQKYECKKPKLKTDAVPSVFPEQPESIHGTVKKRKKLEAYSEQYQKGLEEKWKNSKITDDFTKAKNRTKTEPEIEDQELYSIKSVILKEELIIKSETNLSTGEIMSNVQDNDINEKSVQKANKNISKTKAITEENATTSKSIPTDLQCKQCPFKGKSLKSLSVHTVRTHNIGKKTQRKSKKPTTKSLQMQKDINQESPQGPKCFKCNYITENKTDLVKHLYDHTVKEIASNKFEKIGQNLNISQVEVPNNLKCQNCCFECNMKTELVTHNMLNHGSFI